MKKFLVFVLACCLGVGLACLAEEKFGVNLAELSTDDLLELRAMIGTELADRDCEASLGMYPGDYVVGKDIPPGGYLICLVEDWGQGGYLIRTDSKLLDGAIMSQGYKYYYRLEEGMFFRVNSGVIVLSPYDWHM